MEKVEEKDKKLFYWNLFRDHIEYFLVYCFIGWVYESIWCCWIYHKLGFINRGFLFGPWIGMIFCCSMDIVNCIVNPKGPYFPGYTVTAVTASLIYALWLYKRPVKLWRVICAEVTVKIVCFLGLNTLWGVMTTGNAASVVAAGKLALNAAKLPADVAIMMILLPVCNTVIKPALSINLRSIKKQKKTAE